MRKQKVLFPCTQNSARSQMSEGFLRHLAGDRFEAYGAGIDPTAEIHPCAVEAMEEVGIDISEQYPKDLKTYMGKMGFNYLIIVYARAEERCPKTFPGIGTTFSWIFEDPRREEDIPYDSVLERVRAVRDEIELKIRDWLEHPERELEKLKEKRERRELLAASQREADDRAWGLDRLPQDNQERLHLQATSLAMPVRGQESAAQLPMAPFTRGSEDAASTHFVG